MRLRWQTSVCTLISITLLTLLTGVPDAEAQNPPSTIRLMQWNVQHSGEGTDKVFDRARQVATAVTQQPDVLTMNEVVSGDVANYVQLIAQATGQTWYQAYVQAQTDGIGNLIVSRFPIVSSAVHHMQTNGVYARAIVEATLDLGGRTINVFSTHLDNADSTVRAAQALETGQFMAGFQGPAVLAGDLNAYPTEADIQPLLVSGVDAWQAAIGLNQAFAYPPDNAVDSLTRTQWTRIDYVLVQDSPAGAINVTSAIVPDVRDLNNTNVLEKLGTSDDKGVRPSDHNPAVVTLQVQDTVHPLDQGPPTVAFTPPDSIFGSVTLHADAADDVAVTKVEFLLDGSPIGTVRTPPFDLAWNSATTTLGAHVLQAIAWDAAGNSTSSGPQSTAVVVAPSPSGDIVLYAADASAVVGTWSALPDAQAAGGVRLQNVNNGVPQLSAALASPTSYVEVPFTAVAGTAYRLWIRGKAIDDSYTNDSVFVQFDQAVTAQGSPIYRIGTTSSVTVNLEDCSGCGLSRWGWQDDGYGVGVLGPLIYFGTTGPQTLRIQPRADGLGIDQVELSPATYLTLSPGALKNDMTLLARTAGGASGPASNTDVPPSVTLTSPAMAASYTAPATVTLSATATDVDGTIAQVEFFANGTSLGVVAAAPYTATWTDVAAGSYAITAVATDNAGVSTNSGANTITVANPPTATPTLPSPWADTDIGAVSPNGSASFDGTTFTVTGSGADIWNAADAFHYVYQPLNGDGQLIARVNSVQDTNRWSKAGAMIRETLAANSKFAQMLVSAAAGSALQYRATTGGSASGTTVTGAAPLWIKIVRSGSTFTGYQSTDGITWQMVGSISISMAASVEIGLAVTSHATGYTATATFDNVAFTSSVASPPVVPSAPNPSDGATNVGVGPTLTWTASGPSTYDVYFGPTNPPPSVTIGQTTASYTPSTLSLNTTYFWQVIARNASGTTPGPVWSFTTAAIPTLTITTTNVPPATVGVRYGVTLMSSGGVGPTAWSLVAGTLPDGLTLSSTGVLNGTPTTQETTAFTVQAIDTDSAATPTTQALTLTVSNGVLLADTFDTLDKTKWFSTLFTGTQDTHVPVSVAGGMLQTGPLEAAVTGSHYNGISSAAYDLSRNGFASVQLIQAPNTATAAYAMFAVGSDGNNFYRWYESADVLVAEKKVGGTKTQLTTVPYDAVADQFLRIRTDVDVSTGARSVVFETAPNNGGVPGAYSVVYRGPWDSGVVVSAMKSEIKAGTSGAVAAPGTVWWDNFLAANP